MEKALLDGNKFITFNKIIKYKYLIGQKFFHYHFTGSFIHWVHLSKVLNSKTLRLGKLSQRMLDLLTKKKIGENHSLELGFGSKAQMLMKTQSSL
jgi:hypothetical protein